MFELNEQVLIEESEKNFEDFIKREKRNLVTFTGDSNLIYLPDAKLEKFKLDPKKKILYLPLQTFLERDLDELETLFHIYFEVALYSDWKKETKSYLYRENNWKKEIDEMTKYILDKVKKLELENDPAYNEKLIKEYVKNEILDFLFGIDKEYSFLRVIQLNPVYKNNYNNKNILNYLDKNKYSFKAVDEMPMHRAFYISFLLIELTGKTPEIFTNPFDTKIFNESLFSFVHNNFIRQINNNSGIKERDPFIKSFIYPSFEKLFKREIDDMKFYKSVGENTESSKSKKGNFDKSDETKDNLESKREDIEKILKEMLEEEQEISANVENIVKGKIDLSPYGITTKDQELFEFYASEMNTQRNQMKRFWQKLIGDAKKEVNVKKIEQNKGKLDVNSLINHYPDYIEAQKKGNFKDLPIFSRYLLEQQAKELPEKIEISFIIDNSGSMKKSKVEFARKALTVTLLSLEDFNQYLKINAEKLNQKVEVLSETWFFGSNYSKIKNFKYKNEKDKEKSDIIRSIVKLDGSAGATDDASLLNEILHSIDFTKESRFKNNKEIKIIFEITDGASSFPGLAKEAVEGLLEKNVKIFAFQIGKNTEKEKQLFDFVWNEGHLEKHGIQIGEEIEKLPEELLKNVGKNIENIFKR